MRVIARLFLIPLYLYRYAVSPLLPAACRFTPTCSEYAVEAVKLHGALKGSLLAMRRLSRCHPFSAMSHDPVPPYRIASIADRKSCHE